ncbi:MAG: hypothetical protein VX726_05940 [Planctomycetota bacterium]|nr:hypothetical protein [Planctomycetota bacterium]
MSPAASRNDVSSHRLVESSRRPVAARRPDLPPATPGRLPGAGDPANPTPGSVEVTPGTVS